MITITGLILPLWLLLFHKTPNTSSSFGIFILALWALVPHNVCDSLSLQFHRGTLVNPRAFLYLCMLLPIRLRPAPSALFQYACWNIQGKPITHCIDALLSSDDDFHVLGV